MHVAVVGGSVGGLTASLVLRDMPGLDVEVSVWERSPHELTQRGAGIGLLPETARYLVDVAGVDLDEFSVATSRIRHLARDGAVAHESAHAYRFSSWNAVYRQLLTCVKPGDYHLNHEMTDWRDTGDVVEIEFANGHRIDADLAVFADGVNSLARSRLLPGVHPRYAGYVAWRGMVHESELSPVTGAALSDAITYHVYANSHILVYPIPGLDGATSPGSRLVNYVWYRNYSTGGDLEDLLTDAEGTRRDVSVPPGAVAAHHVAEMREHAAARLPTAVAEVVCSTEQPFIQVVYDLDIPRMAFGRTCLLGDAAFLGRPHAAAGTAKAADDAWALAGALRSAAASGHTVTDALAEYEASQIPVGRQLIERTERIGRRSQVDCNWTPGDPDLIFGLRGPGS
ncbi:MAG: FAD-dependent monooxygenase [Ilumatobacteraceae bacterium]